MLKGKFIRPFLKRPCKKCNQPFLPTGKTCRICEDCKRKLYLEGQRRKNGNNKKNANL